MWLNSFVTYTSYGLGFGFLIYFMGFCFGHVCSYFRSRG